LRTRAVSAHAADEVSLVRILNPWPVQPIVGMPVKEQVCLGTTSRGVAKTGARL